MNPSVSRRSPTNSLSTTTSRSGASVASTSMVPGSPGTRSHQRDGSREEFFRWTFGGEGNTKGTAATYGTQEADPNGRYPSNVVGYLDEDHLKFFYAPRVSREEKGYYNDHPTTKPIALMEWLIKIYSPPGSTVLDPFMGSGSTGLAAVRSARSFLGIDLSSHYVGIAQRRFEEEIAVGRWSGRLSVKTEADSKTSGGGVGEAVK
jgi:DNA modification methylase